MLGKINAEFEKWDYEKRRLYLIVNSAGFYILKTFLDVNYPDHKSFTDPDLRFSMIQPKYDILLSKLSKDLQVSKETLENIFDFGINWVTETQEAEPIIYQASEITPITQEGFYIRVEGDTQLSSVVKAFGSIKEKFEIHNAHVRNPKEMIRLRKKERQPSVSSVQIYIAIQKDILDEIIGNKNDKLHSLISGSIGMISELMFPKEENAYEKIKDIYYTVEKFYNLSPLSYYQKVA